jgi:RNA polymerase sigma factor (sigma-70 family)
MAVLPWASDRGGPERGKRDDVSFEELFERHRHALAGYCRVLVRDEHDARDVLQNVAIRALLSFRRGDRPERERAWLYRIAHNEAVTLFRTRRQSEQLDESIVEPAPGPARVVLSRERLSELAGGIGALSPRARRILLMSSVEGIERGAIGAELGISPGAVSQSLLESRAALRLDLAAHELPCDAVRSILDRSDGRRTRTRPVRAHLRGCSACRTWELDNGRRTGLGALIPTPIAALAKWIAPLMGGDPGSSALIARPGMGASQAVGLIASLAVGTAGVTGGASNLLPPEARRGPSHVAAHVNRIRPVTVNTVVYVRTHGYAKRTASDPDPAPSPASPKRGQVAVASPSHTGRGHRFSPSRANVRSPAPRRSSSTQRVDDLRPPGAERHDPRPQWAWSPADGAAPLPTQGRGPRSHGPDDRL